MSFTVKNVDRGYDAIRDAVASLDGVEVIAGSIGTGGSGSTQTFISRKTGKPLEGNEPVATVFSWHEFGSGVPERSVLRRVFDNNPRSAPGSIQKSLNVMIRDRGRAATVTREAGEFYVKRFRKTIREGKVLKPLAAATKADPGRNTRYIPLWDTGQIVSSLNSRVKK